MNEYINNDIDNPKYLFYGSSKPIDVNDNSKENFPLFMTSSFIAASGYAFKDKIKEQTEGVDWKFEIGRDDSTGNVFVVMNNVNVTDDIEGYIYVFEFDESYPHEKRSIHYKHPVDVTPIDVVKVNINDFKEYYSINENV